MAFCKREGGLTWKRHLFSKINKQGKRISTQDCQRCGKVKVEKTKAA